MPPVKIDRPPRRRAASAASADAADRAHPPASLTRAREARRTGTRRRARSAARDPRAAQADPRATRTSTSRGAATRSRRSPARSSASRSRSRPPQSIWRRFAAAGARRRRTRGARRALDPARVARDATRRRCAAAGCRERKADYLRDLAAHFASGALDPAAWPALDDEALIERARRRQGHRPLDRRDVPHLPRAARRRAAGRRHRPAERRSRSTTTTASGLTPTAMRELARRLAAVAQRRDVVPVALARSDPGRVLTLASGHTMFRCARGPYNGPREPPLIRTRELTPDRVLDALDSVGIAATAGCWRSAATRIASTRSGARTAPPRRGQVLPARTLVGRRDPRGARVRRGARGSARFRSSRRSRSTATTLHAFGGFRFAVYPKCGGRAPELEDRATLEWMGRFLGRIHAVGATHPFAHRPALDLEIFGDEPRDWLLAHDFIPPDLLAGVAQHRRAGARRRAPLRTSAPATSRRCGCTATATPATCLWTDARPALRRLRRRADGPGGAGPVDAALGRPRGDDAPARERCSTATRTSREFDPRELHLVEALRTLRLLHYSAWLAQRWDDPAFPGGVPLVQHAALLAGPHPRAARAGRADGRAAARRLRPHARRALVVASASTPSTRCSVRSVRAASSGSWVTITRLVPTARLSSSIRSNTSPAVRRSRLPVGSSASTQRGAVTSARASATRCRSPPESSPGGARRDGRDRRARASPAPRRARRPAARAGSTSGIATFSSAVNSGSRWWNW